MKIAEAEKKLAAFVAETTRLIPDYQVFAGNMPEDLPEGICVNFTRGTPAGLENSGEFTALITGRFNSISLCRTSLNLLISALPAFGINGFLAVKATENDPVKLLRSAENEAECFTFQLELTVNFI